MADNNEARNQGMSTPDLALKRLIACLAHGA